MKSLVVLVQPEAFFFNAETAKNNYFQVDDPEVGRDRTAGINELATFAGQLEERGVTVLRVPLPASEGGDAKPDAIFPNNSFSLHAVRHLSASSANADDDVGNSASTQEGTWAVHGFLWPMSPGRVDEIPFALRRALGSCCASVHDLRHIAEMPEGSGVAGALEGTGALVFSADNEAVFMARSTRASEDVLRLLTSMPGAAPFQAPQLRTAFVFAGKDSGGRSVYHTNVLGWCGSKVAAWCMEGLTFDAQADGASGSSSRSSVVAFDASEQGFRKYFAGRGITLLSLSFDEMHHFAGNCLELFAASGRPLLTMSSTAWEHLSDGNRAALLDAYGGPDGIVVAHVPTVERLGGGSVRCLQAHFNYPDEAPLSAFVQKFVDSCRAS